MVTITIVHEVKHFLCGIFLKFHYYAGGGHLICRVILYSGITINTLCGQNAKFMNVKAGGPHTEATAVLKKDYTILPHVCILEHINHILVLMPHLSQTSLIAILISKLHDILEIGSTSTLTFCLYTDTYFHVLCWTNLFKSEPGDWVTMKNNNMFSLNRRRKCIISIHLMPVSTNDIHGHTHTHTHTHTQSVNFMTFTSTNSVRENLSDSSHLEELEEDGL